MTRLDIVPVPVIMQLFNLVYLGRLRQKKLVLKWHLKVLLNDLSRDTLEKKLVKTYISLYNKIISSTFNYLPAR